MSRYTSSFGLTGYESRPYCSSDIQAFAKSRGLSSTEVVSIFSKGTMSASAFSKHIGIGSDILSTPLQILFRMYLRYPKTIPMPQRLTVTDFFEEELGGEEKIATRYRGILFGVDKNSGYNWGTNSSPISTVQATMLTAKILRKTRGLTQEELLIILVDIHNATTAALKINPMKTGSWGRKNGGDEALKLSHTKVGNSSVKMRGRRVNKKQAPGSKVANRRSLINLVRNKLSTDNFRISFQASSV